MNKFIKTFSWLLAAMTAISLVSCGTSSSSASSSESSSTATSSESSVSESSSSSEGYTSSEHLSEPAIVFHYHRTDGDYTDWNLWLWDYNGGNGKNFYFGGRDAYGVYGTFALSTWPSMTQLGFIVTLGTAWADKDPATDRYVTISEWTPDTYDEIHIYLESGQTKLYTDAQGTVFNAISSAYFTTTTAIKVAASNIPTKIDVKADGEIIKSGTEFTSTAPTVTLDSDMSFNIGYTVDVYFDAALTDVRTAQVGIFKLYDTTLFTDNYIYDGDDLGVTYSAAESTFKLWAPISASVILHIYDTGTPTSISATLGSDVFQSYDMVKGEKGVWSTTVAGDLNGKYYTYVVTSAGVTSEVVDPYARSAGINGRRGMILDLAATDPEGWDAVSFDPIASPADLSIYELHVRDLTMDSTWNGSESNRGKYLGLVESGTTYTSGGVTVKTGFDHLKELGVNAVQILPFFDQDNDETQDAFNWGYNPLNYNVMEGSYSSDPYDGAVRVREVKEMVKGLADAGIRVIMDVVYNHVAGLASSNFNKIVPGYYFRYQENGTPSSGSGCGNDTASERAMFGKFMIDSVKYLASEYKLGGYRFDLMGLHDVSTMTALAYALKGINSDIAIYGEPWTMSTATKVSLANQSKLNSIPYVAGFNDNIRDGVKGSYSSISAQGWIQSASPSSTQVTNVKNGMKGALNSVVKSPVKSLNYVSCHDNATLYDKLTNSGISEADAPKVDVQAQTIVFTSQGIPFMQAGEEMMRQKTNADGTVNQNSYNAPDSVNALKWDRKVTYKAAFDKYVELIKLRKDHAIFRYTSDTLVTNNYTALSDINGTALTSTTLAYKLTKDASITDSYNDILVIHNGNNAGVSYTLDGTYKVAFKTDDSDIVDSNVTAISLAANVSVVLYQ